MGSHSGATKLDGFMPSAHRRSARMMDLVLVVGVLAWIAVHGFLETHPAEYGAFSALFVGVAIHRGLDLWEQRVD